VVDDGYQQEHWNLNDLFPDFGSPEMQSALDQVEQQLQVFEAYRDLLSTDLDAKEFLAILRAYEELTRGINRLYGYSSLRFAADTQDQTAQVNLAGIQQLIATAQNRALFFELWWKNLADEPAFRLQQSSGDYHYWLESLRRERSFTLTEPEERIINLKDVNGPAALLTLQSTIPEA